MKKEKFFDILGEIDDKFYEEARGDDAEQPIIIEDDAPRKRNPLKIILPAAACLALISVIGITALRSNNAAIIPPNYTEVSDSKTESSLDSNSESASSDNGAVYIEINQSDIDKAVEYLKTAFPEKFDDSDEDRSYDTGTMDIDGDGKAELLVNIFDTDIYVFDKNGGEIQYSGSFERIEGLDTVDEIHMYNGDDGKYAYFFSLQYSKNVNANAQVVTAIKYDGENYYVEPLLACGTMHGTGSDDRFKRFWQKGWSGENLSLDEPVENEISEEEFRALWAKYPALPKILMPESDENDNTFDPDDYPMLDITDIPDVERTGLDDLSDEDREKCISKATLAYRTFGEYAFYLTAEYIHTNKSQGNDDLIYSDTLKIRVCRNGRPIANVRPQINSLAGARMGYSFYRNKVACMYKDSEDDYFDIMTVTADDGTELPVLALKYYHSPYAAETCFYSVYGDNFGYLLTDINNIDGFGDSPCITLSNNYVYSDNALTDIDEDIRYTFDPQNIIYTLSNSDYSGSVQYTSRYMNTPVDISEYPLIEPSTLSHLTEDAYYEKASLLSKQCGDYMLTMIARNIRSDPSFDGAINCTGLRVIVTKNGGADADPRYIGFTRYASDTGEYYLDASAVNGGSRITDYVTPFEMKDGIGYAEYPYNVNNNQILARFILLKDDKIQVMSGFESESRWGEYWEVGNDMQIIPENDEIIGQRAKVSYTGDTGEETVTYVPVHFKFSFEDIEGLDIDNIEAIAGRFQFIVTEENSGD